MGGEGALFGGCVGGEGAMAVLGSGMAKMWLLVLFGLLVVAPGFHFVSRKPET